MKTLLSLLLVLTVSSASADTYTLYMVRGDARLFDDATDQDWLTRIYSNEAIIEILIETDGSSPSGTNQTHAIDYIQEWDDAGTPKSRTSRAVGSKFRVQEQSNIIAYEFSDTRLERWVPVSPPKPLLQPIFKSRAINSQLALKKGSFVVVGGLSAEEIHNGVSKKVIRYFIIGRK